MSNSQSTDSTIFTVTQVNNQVKYALEQNFNHVWIKGELSAPKQYASGHLYFTLKDENSEISAVMFARQNAKLHFRPSNGQKVIVSGKISLYLPRGQYQLIVTNMYPGGQGELWLAYERLKQKLEQEGLFAGENKKPLPNFPSRIGVITSSSGSVLRDIIYILSRRAPHVQIFLRPVLVQGKTAARDIANAISDFNEFGAVDLLIVGRGGGAMEDLWCFNEESVARAIFGSRLPIISAVGHETDFTIADFVADVRASTPSVAAELAAPVKDDLLQHLDDQVRRMSENVLGNIRYYHEALDNITHRHGFQKPTVILEKLFERLNTISSKLQTNISTRIDQHYFQLDSINKILQNLNPENVLTRGYTMVFDKKKKIITSPDSVMKNDLINIKFSTGKITANVIENN